MDDLLVKWEQSLGNEKLNQITHNIERRSFLHNSIKASAALALLPAIGLFSACSEDKTETQQDLETLHPWASFNAVQMILFPNDGNGPDARQINATAYLKFALESKDTDPDDREFILGGIEWLNDLSNKQYQKKFIECDQQQQESVITKTASSNAGERWLSYLLLYIFEALLSDPVYGGNPNGIGWEWLNHQPGFPTPPIGKRYMDLT